MRSPSIRSGAPASIGCSWSVVADEHELDVVSLGEAHQLSELTVADHGRLVHYQHPPLGSRSS